jgi:error-prone DNA polymerase
VYVIIKDGTGVADVTVFSDVQEKCGPVLFRAGWLIVKGKIQRRGERSVSIIADDLSAFVPMRDELIRSGEAQEQPPL